MIGSNVQLLRTGIYGLAVLLGACGGGGSSSSGGVEAPAGSSANPSYSISGTAAKGLLLNATVKAYCGDEAQQQLLASTTTDGKTGTYQISWKAACDQPVELVTMPKPDGSTSMLDETSDEPIAVPENFTLHAFVPTVESDKPLSLPITPFTDMAATVLKNSIQQSKGQTSLNAATVNSAIFSIVTNVLGGNRTLYDARPLPPSDYDLADENQKQVIVLLAAISQAAKNLTGTQTQGEKVQQIVAELGDKARQNFTISDMDNRLSLAADGNNTPIAIINRGLEALKDSNATAGLGNATNAQAIKERSVRVRIVVGDMAIKQINTTVKQGGKQGLPPAQSSIASATRLINTVRNNLLELSDAQQAGFVQTKSKALSDDMKTLSAQVNYGFTDVMLAAHRAVSLLAKTNAAVNAAAAGGNATPATPVNASAQENVFGKYFQQTWSGSGGTLVVCSAYYTDGTGLTNAATAPATRTSPVSQNAGKPVVICNMDGFDGNSKHTMQFVVKSPSNTPASGKNDFSYVNRIRNWTNAGCKVSANPVCSFTDSNELNGTLNAAVNTDLDVVGMTMNHQPVLPYQGNTPAYLSLNYLASKSSGVGNSATGGNTVTANFSATMESGPLSFGFVEGSNLVFSDTSNAASKSIDFRLSLIGQIKTSAFQYDGSFGFDGRSKKVQNAPDPQTEGSIDFKGKVSSLSQGIPSTFIDGHLNIKTNPEEKSMAFSGSVTNDTKVNQLTMELEEHMAGQYVFRAGFLTPGYSFHTDMRSSEANKANNTMNITASDGSVIAVTQQANGKSVVQVKAANGEVIGTLNDNQINFTDGTYILLN
ncbi:MAG: hypothetical protein ORN29_03220 [Rhodoferax sp.]|nr:hypothetical protein [Rhodoferax sp.]